MRETQNKNNHDKLTTTGTHNQNASVNVALLSSYAYALFIRSVPLTLQHWLDNLGRLIHQLDAVPSHAGRGKHVQVGEAGLSHGVEDLRDGTRGRRGVPKSLLQEKRFNVATFGQWRLQTTAR